MTRAFVNDVWERIINRPQISTDGFGPYIGAIAEVFGDGADYAQLIKHYSADHAVEAKRRYSPASVVRVERRVVSGRRDRHVSTSLVERSNLTFRMQQRRFTRLTNGFSKKLANHRAAVGLFVAHYNLCRVHESLRVTPAMAQGVTDHIWDIGELIEAATGNEAPEPEGRRVGQLRVINGGLTWYTLALHNPCKNWEVTMTKSYACSDVGSCCADVGTTCDWKTSAETEDEAMTAIRTHVAQVHPTIELTPGLVGEIRAAIKDE